MVTSGKIVAAVISGLLFIKLNKFPIHRIIAVMVKNVKMVFRLVFSYLTQGVYLRYATIVNNQAEHGKGCNRNGKG